VRTRSEPRTKSFTRRKEGGGESGLVIMMGRITRAINKNREVGGGREGEEGKGDSLVAADGLTNGEGNLRNIEKKRMAIGESIIRISYIYICEVISQNLSNLEILRVREIPIFYSANLNHLNI
jgi:hypothetical protein